MVWRQLAKFGGQGPTSATTATFEINRWPNQDYNLAEDIFPMNDYVWTPPGLSEDDAANFLTPRGSLPESARSEILRWLVRDKYDHEQADLGEYLEFQTAFRQPLGLLPLKSAEVRTVRDWLAGLDEGTLTALLDFRLAKALPRPSHNPKPQDKVASLRAILTSAGSRWTVGDRGGRWGLIEALPDAVIEVAKAVVSESVKASRLLSAAWSNAFGIDKRPSHAYFDAVRAVEVFSCPLISPEDRKATLGKDINVLQTNPDAWSFALTGDQSIERLLATLRLLWHSQTDRHGREDYEDVSIEECQAAVLLATTIVGWLSRGLLVRAPESPEPA